MPLRKRPSGQSDRDMRAIRRRLRAEQRLNAPVLSSSLSFETVPPTPSSPPCTGVSSPWSTMSSSYLSPPCDPRVTSWKPGQGAREMRALRRSMRQDSDPPKDTSIPPPLFDSPRLPPPTWHSPPTYEDVANLQARLKFGLSVEWYANPRRR